MDYFAEIANAPDAVEALIRLRAATDAPGHLLEAPLEQLRSKVPTIWRAELANWFYHRPGFAARVWQELRYCRLHRERVARAAVTQVALRPLTASFGGGASPERLQSLPAAVRFVPYLRAAWIQAVVSQYRPDIHLNQDPESAIRTLAAALKPSGPLTEPREMAHAFMEDLSTAAEVTYDPPNFIDRLLREIESAAAARNRFTWFRPTSPQARRLTPAELIAHRRVVLRLAKEHCVPVPFSIVHGEELTQIAETREETHRAHAYAEAANAAPDTVPPCSCPPDAAIGEIPDASPIRRALSQNLVGLAFSGGGIRSATFNLGVLQELAKLDILRHCDYLSTVSGGGYIGSWFSAWLHREGERLHNSSDPGQYSAEAALDEIRRVLSPNGSPNPLAPRVRPIRYLREFSNYLTPQTGFFSADTWTMAAIYIRNLILNLLVLIPLLAAGLLIPRVVFAITAFLLNEQRGPFWIPSIVAGLLAIAACILILNLRRATLSRNVLDRNERPQRNLAGQESVPRYSRQGWIQFSVVVPLLIVAWLTASSYWLALWSGCFQLADGGPTLAYWGDRWTLPGFAALLPNSPKTAAEMGALLGVVMIAGVYILARNLASRWLPAGQAIIAFVLTSATSFWAIWLLIQELNILTTILKASAPWQALLHSYVSALAAIVFVLLYVVLAAAVCVRRKTLIDSVPHWLSAAIFASAAAITTLGVLFALRQFLASLEPNGKVSRLLSHAWPSDTITAISLAAAVVVVIFLSVFWTTRGFTLCWPKRAYALGSLVLALAGSGVAGFCAFWGLGILLKSESFTGMEGFWHTVAFGTPLTLAVFALVAVVQLGLLGINFPDEQREWWSRLRAWTLIYSAAWTGLFLLAIYPPVWARHIVQALPNWGGLGAIALWVLSTAAGVKTGSIATAAEKKSREATAAQLAGAPPVPNKPMSATALKAIATVAPYIFMLGLLALLSLIVYWTLDTSSLNQSPDRFWKGLTESSHVWLLLAAIALGLFSTLISWRIGVNEFSMHHFYKNRLVRCYLGASRWKERKADWFTGFDSADDIRLKCFDRHAGGRHRYHYPGPYPIVNAALNLVAGDDLAWQERKASSFTFTPKYCGYDVDRAVLTPEKGPYWPDAYAPTSAYMFEKLGPMLGTAMAISGAAANPNMGKVTTAASAFLMTVFNVRLGWWLPNPRRKERWTDPTPRLGVTYGAVELFGLTNDKRQFVNISDGGHFENLGVYELIRRGCRFVIACDAGQDGSFGMEDLGNMIRKCRTDFGVEIDICIDRIRERDQHGWSKAHCVVGTIRYPGVAKHCKHGRILMDNGMPVGEDGLFIYLKPSISGDEPYDILEYFTRVPEFPHETTADQWFNESQFESYRRLGLHIAESTFQRYREREDEPVFPPQLFERLHRFWYPPSLKIAEYSTEHTLEYSRIMELIRSRADLQYLDRVLFEDAASLGGSLRDEFYICNALIQLIENVYADLDLEQNYAHPHVGGWMKVFQHWAKQPSFQRTWRQSQGTYAERFRGFYNDRLVNGRCE